MIEWRRVALAYPCPTCLAWPGEQCLTATGRRSWALHAARCRQATQHQWQTPPDVR